MLFSQLPHGALQAERDAARHPHPDCRASVRAAVAPGMPRREELRHGLVASKLVDQGAYRMDARHDGFNVTDRSFRQGPIGDVTLPAISRTLRGMEGTETDTQLMKAWGDRVLYTALARGHTSMKAFAEALGLGSHTANKWKRGNGTTIPQIVRISRRLRVTTDFLLTGSIDGMAHGELNRLVAEMQKGFTPAKARHPLTKQHASELWPELATMGAFDDWPEPACL